MCVACVIILHTWDSHTWDSSRSCSLYVSIVQFTSMVILTRTLTDEHKSSFSCYCRVPCNPLICTGLRSLLSPVCCVCLTSSSSSAPTLPGLTRLSAHALFPSSPDSLLLPAFHTFISLHWHVISLTWRDKLLPPNCHLSGFCSWVKCRSYFIMF